MKGKQSRGQSRSKPYSTSSFGHKGSCFSWTTPNMQVFDAWPFASPKFINGLVNYGNL
ncbi:hypothetical protein CR513_57603, partial [Mucuna pruriens]